MELDKYKCMPVPAYFLLSEPRDNEGEYFHHLVSIKSYMPRGYAESKISCLAYLFQKSVSTCFKRYPCSNISLI